MKEILYARARLWCSLLDRRFILPLHLETGIAKREEMGK